MRRGIFAFLLALITLGVTGEPDSWGEMAVNLLQEYLRIDTTVPPGREIEAARFYKSILEREGIAAEIDEFEPGRANLLAVVKGGGAQRPLILLNHMDVVPADSARWTVPRFSGLRRGGLLYGRGAQDMKSEGILQLTALIRARRDRLPLDRDIFFLATADEEADFRGVIRALSPNGWLDMLRNAEYLITEGGENLGDENGRPVSFGVATGEKGPYWLQLRTSGTPGHGSRPIEDSALNRMIRALERIRNFHPPMKALPSVERFFRDQSSMTTGPRAAWYKDIRNALRDPVVADTLYRDRQVSALLRNTISITVVHAGYKTNVIPGTAEAELDVRLLPGEDPAEFLAEIRKVINDPSVDVIPPADFRSPNESSADTELFRVIRETLARYYPGIPVSTRMLTGATESVFFRPFGISCYGFTPLVATVEESDSGHGDDERIRESTVRESASVFYDVVARISAGSYRPPGPRR